MKNNKKDSIKGFLFVFWFITTIICAFIFKDTSYWNLIVFGQAFFVFGIVGVLSIDDFSREDYPLFLFILVGFTLIEIGLVGIIKIEYTPKIILSIISNSIILFGLLILMFEKKYKVKHKKRKLADFEERKKGKIFLFQRAYRYNIRDLNLIKENKKYVVNLIIKSENIDKKDKPDKFAKSIGIFFIILGIFIKLLCI